MFAAPKSKKLSKSNSTNDMQNPTNHLVNRLPNMLYKTVLDNFNLTNPSIKLAEEVTSFIKKNRDVNENKVKTFINKISVLAQDIKHKEQRKQLMNRTKYEASQEKKNVFLPEIQTKPQDKNDTQSHKSFLPKNFAVNQLIKNYPFVREELIPKIREETFSYDAYHSHKIKQDVNDYFELQKLKHLQKKAQQKKYKDDLEEQMKLKQEKNIENEQKERELDRNLLMLTEEPRKQNMIDKEYVKDLDKILEDKIKHKIMEYKEDYSLDKELIKNYVNNEMIERNKKDQKRKLNKEVQEENKKIDEIKKGLDLLEKEKEKEKEINLLIDQEKMNEKEEIYREKILLNNEKKEKSINKKEKISNLESYEEYLKKLQNQSMMRCQELDKKITCLEDKMDRKGINTFTTIFNPKKEIKIFRPKYNAIGTDNHVSTWKLPEEKIKKVNNENNSKSKTIEGFKKAIKPKENSNKPEFFATQVVPKGK